VGVSDARLLYDGLTDDLLYDPAVGRSTMMGYPCMRRAGGFFASFDTRAEALVVKLPHQRVAELIAERTGEPFVPNGRVFREWVTISNPDPITWRQLLVEARDFATPASRATSGYDEELAHRIREALSQLSVENGRERNMFGGLAFLVGGHLAVAASGEGGVLVSVDRKDTNALLAKPNTQPMVMRGRELAGWVRVDPAGVRTKRQLLSWVRRGVDHARSLPPKEPSRTRSGRGDVPQRSPGAM
jgi:hypothetical protein